MGDDWRWEMIGGDGIETSPQITNLMNHDLASWNNRASSDPFMIVYGYCKGGNDNRNILPQGWRPATNPTPVNPMPRDQVFSFSCRFQTGLLAAFGNSFDMFG